MRRTFLCPRKWRKSLISLKHRFAKIFLLKILVIYRIPSVRPSPSLVPNEIKHTEIEGSDILLSLPRKPERKRSPSLRRTSHPCSRALHWWRIHKHPDLVLWRMRRVGLSCCVETMARDERNGKVRKRKESGKGRKWSVLSRGGMRWGGRTRRYSKLGMNVEVRCPSWTIVVSNPLEVVESTGKSPFVMNVKGCPDSSCSDLLDVSIKCLQVPNFR
jgi:hypothetical protein